MLLLRTISNAIKFRLSIVLLFVISVTPVNALYDNTQSQEKVYTLLMLNFARGIQWPGNVNTGNFVIGVYEYPPLAAELSGATTSLKIGSQKIVVKEFTRPDEVSACHILFVPAYKARSFDAIVNKVGSQPTLIVTNKVDLAKKGSGVNFILVDGKLRYEINCKSIEKRGMKVSSNVKGMGIIVD